MSSKPQVNMYVCRVGRETGMSAEQSERTVEAQLWKAWKSDKDLNLRAKEKGIVCISKARL